MMGVKEPGVNPCVQITSAWNRSNLGVFLCQEENWRGRGEHKKWLWYAAGKGLLEKGWFVH